MKAWHFIRNDWTTGEGQLPVHVGETLRVEPPLSLCERGLHASLDPLHALHYAPGPVVCRVEVGGEIVQGGDKLCATERTVLWAYDATDVLRHFARLCALDVVHLWDAPEVVLRYLKTGDESMWAATRAADAAARAAGVARAAQSRRLARMLREKKDFLTETRKD